MPRSILDRRDAKRGEKSQCNLRTFRFIQGKATGCITAAGTGTIAASLASYCVSGPHSIRNRAAVAKSTRAEVTAPFRRGCSETREKYDGPRSMAEVHRGMRISEAQFNAVVEDLTAAMTSRHITVPVQNRLLKRLASERGNIIYK